MGQGVLSEYYAKKIVIATNEILENKLTCDTDKSFKTIIVAETIYLFKSIDKAAQTKFIELMLEVKKEIGDSFEKFYITSALRSPMLHANTHIRTKIPSDYPHSEYAEPSKSYYLALQDMYHGRRFDQRLIKNKSDIALI